jgi:hypothetical protein
MSHAVLLKVVCCPNLLEAYGSFTQSDHSIVFQVRPELCLTLLPVYQEGQKNRLQLGTKRVTHGHILVTNIPTLKSSEERLQRSSSRKSHCEGSRH